MSISRAKGLTIVPLFPSWMIILLVETKPASRSYFPSHTDIMCTYTTRETISTLLTPRNMLLITVELKFSQCIKSPYMLLLVIWKKNNLYLFSCALYRCVFDLVTTKHYTAEEHAAVSPSPFLTWSFRVYSLLVMSNYGLIRTCSFWFPNRDLFHERLRSATKSSGSEAIGTRPWKGHHNWRVSPVAGRRNCVARGPVYETLLPVDTPITVYLMYL